MFEKNILESNFMITSTLKGLFWTGIMVDTTHETFSATLFDKAF